MVKGQGKKVRNLEAELLETAKRVSKKATDASGTMTYKDRDEKLLRDKLVTRLKEKEVQKMEHFGERLKNAKENNYIETSDDGVEDISDEDLDQVTKMTAIFAVTLTQYMSKKFNIPISSTFFRTMAMNSKEKRTTIFV